MQWLWACPKCKAHGTVEAAVGEELHVNERRCIACRYPLCTMTPPTTT